tara:strand:+ start:3555 stop:5507 length:1953 start_codon:yes stop_codon:yes gene_type:complete
MNCNINNYKFVKLITLITISQFLTILPLIAETGSTRSVSEDESNSNPKNTIDALKVVELNKSSETKWDLINDKNTFANPPLIWRPINNEKSKSNKNIYWEGMNQEEIQPLKRKKPFAIYSFEESYEVLKNIEYKEQINSPIFELGKSLPTAHTLKQGDLQISFEQVSPINKGYAGGTGNQNYTGSIDFGVIDTFTFKSFYTHSDDPLHRRINQLSKQPANRWISYGAGFKWQAYSGKNINLAIDSSIENWEVKSGGCNRFRCTNESNNIFNSNIKEVNNSNLVGSISLPLTWMPYSNFEITLGPKIVFLPEEQGNRLGNGKFYGNNFGIGAGFSYQPIFKLKTFGSAFVPFGPGNNSFDENLDFKRVAILTGGINYSLDPKIAFEAYLTNSFGGSPATSILALPSSNEILYGGRLIYKPTNSDSPKFHKSTREIRSKDGLSVASSQLIKTGKHRLKISYNDKGSWMFRKDWGVSELFNFDLSGGKIMQNPNSNSKLFGKYHNKNEFMIRGGGTAIFFSQERGDALSSGFRLTAGRARGWGWIFGEMINSYQLSKNLDINLNPKLALSGNGNPYGIGTSLNWQVFPGISILPETNIALSEGDSNWTFAIRLAPMSNTYIDIFTTNSLSFMDVGQLLKAQDQSYGVNLSFDF